ncbi:MAG: DNA adenine methylase [Alloprevotella sp.]|nr:DNA adenine methylase [Alloprevotella sp.]
MSWKLYSPLRYPGGKNCIFKFLSSLFYENDLIGIEYAEPYAGGAGLALHLLMEGYVSKIYLNDLDEWVYAFWHTILSSKDDFCTWLKNIEVNIETWRVYKEMLSKPSSLTTFEKAQVFFFLNRTNVSGVIKGGAIGGLLQKGAYKIDARFNKLDLIERIERIYQRRSDIELCNLDGIDFLKKINRKHRNIFIYIDPPYVIKGSNLYLNFYTQTDHAELAEMIKKIRKQWLVSYDNCELINSLYYSYPRISYQLAQGTSNKIGEEMLIFPENLIFDESISKLSAPTLL